MDRVVRAPPSGVEATPWGLWTLAAHRYVLPVVAAVALTVGLGLVVDFSSAIAEFLPLLMVLLGAATLSTSLVFLRWHQVRPSPGPAAPSNRPKATIAPPPRTRARDPSPVVPARPPSPVASPAMAPARPLAWGEVFATVSTPADQLWHEWQPDAVQSIGAELIGPVAETYFAPVAEGQIDAFPEKEPDWVLEEPSPSTGPLSIGASEALGGPGSFGGLSGVEFEALTGVPPHLRTPGPHPTKLVPVLINEPRTPTALAARSCATCTTSIGDPRWRACPGCHLPVCADCILDALLAYGTAYCGECASERSLVVN